LHSSWRWSPFEQVGWIHLPEMVEEMVSSFAALTEVVVAVYMIDVTRVRKVLLIEAVAAANMMLAIRGREALLLFA
jgi:hypothetical protein